jgi:hypothetical protein
VLNSNFVIIDNIEGICLDGSVPINADADIRRTFDLTVLLTGKYTEDYLLSLVGIDKYVKIYTGLDNNKTGNTVWFNHGVFVFDAPSFTYDSNSRTLKVKGSDLITKLQGNRGGQLEELNTVIPAGSIVKSAVESLISQAGFTKYVVEPPFDKANFQIQSTAWRSISLSPTQSLALTSPLPESGMDMVGFTYAFVLCGKCINSTSATLQVYDTSNGSYYANATYSIGNIKKAYINYETFTQGGIQLFTKIANTSSTATIIIDMVYIVAINNGGTFGYPLKFIGLSQDMFTRIILETVDLLHGSSIDNITKMPATLPIDISLGVGASIFDLLKKVCDLYAGYEMYFDEDGVFSIFIR